MFGLLGEVPMPIGLIITDDIGPAEVASLACLVDLVHTGRTFVFFAAAGVRTDFTPIEVTVFLIHGDAEGIAVAHDINFRTSAGGARCEQVALGNRVGAICFGVDAINFAAEVVRVSGGFLGIPGERPARSSIGA